MLPLPPITSNTSHYRICRRCAAPCLQLCACRCCSHMLPLPPIRTNTSHYRICRRCATLHATLRLPLFFSFALSLQSQPIPHTTVFTDGSPPSACNFAPAAVVLMFLSLQAQPIPHTTVLADGAPPPACNFAPAAAVLKLPLPSINTNTSHHRICRRCAAPCLQLCACRCCSHDSVALLYVASVLHWHGVSCEQTQHLTPPFLQYIYLTPPYLQKVRRPLHATKRLPLLFSCSLSLQSEPIPHTTVGVCRCSSRR